MISVEKTCPVCGSKFVVDKRVAEGDLFCTLGCCLKNTSKDMLSSSGSSNIVPV